MLTSKGVLTINTYGEAFIVSTLFRLHLLKENDQIRTSTYRDFNPVEFKRAVHAFIKNSMQEAAVREKSMRVKTKENLVFETASVLFLDKSYNKNLDLDSSLKLICFLQEIECSWEELLEKACWIHDTNLKDLRFSCEQGLPWGRAF